ncbi:MAG: biopolymer transporter ExbD [Myxococcota bacterium]|nr:biopolymer transporter ExbD [Myxococcota bacterium]
MAGGALSEADDAITGINVTPLVDITLVLLIIFMVTTKIVMNQTVPLDLPKAATGTSDVQVVFSIILAADGRAVVDGNPVANDDTILQLARDAQTQHADLRAVIKADAAVTHGRVIHVLDLLKQAHVSKIAFGVSPVLAQPR